MPTLRLLSLFLVTLLTAAPAYGAPRDSSIDRPRPLILANSMGSANLMLAGMGISIHRLENLPEGRRVRLSGKVDSVSGSRIFTLRDSTGTVDVFSAQSLSEDVKEGFEVSVTGRVRRGLFGTEIKATSIRPVNPPAELVFGKKPRPARLASVR
jgi:uncharacterized protein YdeI (BOF family)